MEDGTVMFVVNNPRLIDSGRYLLNIKNRAGVIDMTYILNYEEVVPPEVEQKRLQKKKTHWEHPIVENIVHPRKFYFLFISF